MRTLVAGTQNMTAAPGLTQGWLGGQMIGHGAATQLVWGGARDGNMFWSHGLSVFRFTGLHWNGTGVAGIAHYHMSDTVYETEDVHEVERFTGFTQTPLSMSLKKPDFKGATAMATSEVLYRNLLIEDSNVGVLINFFNCYDNTFDGVLFRDLEVGIYSRAGIMYVRNSRFERSAVCDIVNGAYELFSSVNRVVSVGSKQFICGQPITQPPFGPTFGAAPMRVVDCHVDAWTGGVAVDVGGVLQVVDSTFTRPAMGAAAVAIKKGNFPSLLSNNSVDGCALTSGFTPDVEVSTAGARCASTGITAGTNFYKSHWPVPGKVVEVADFALPAPAYIQRWNYTDSTYVRTDGVHGLWEYGPIALAPAPPPAVVDANSTCQHGLDMVGPENLGEKTTASSAECCTMCGTEPKCSAFTWLRVGVAGQCWMRSRASAPYRLATSKPETSGDCSAAGSCGRAQCASCNAAAGGIACTSRYTAPGCIPPNVTFYPRAAEAVQRCIIAASKVGKSICYLPRAIYDIETTLEVPRGADGVYWIGGTGFMSILQWVGPSSASAGPVMHIAPGTAVRLHDFQVFPANMSAEVQRVAIEGCGAVGCRSITNVTIDGLHMQGDTDYYRTARISAGVSVRHPTAADIVDAYYFDGDLEVVGSGGKVVTGFHMNGESWLEYSNASAGAKVKFTGLAQNLGQLQASNRYFQSNCWANL
jgi:hypothetical protein